MIKGKLKGFDGYRIERIKADEVYQFLLNRHYARRIPSISYCFGLFKDNEIVGVLTIGKPASPSLCDGICGKEYSSRVYELNRLFLEGNLPKNMASAFISRCLGYLRPPPHQHDGFIIVSYADTKMNHCGYIYQASNWIYTGITEPKTDYQFEGLNKHSRHVKNKEIGAVPVERSQKHRYVYFIGDKQFKRKMLKKLNYPIQDYPKAEVKHYDDGQCEKQIYMFS